MARYLLCRPHFLTTPPIKSLGAAPILPDIFNGVRVETSAVGVLAECGGSVETWIYTTFISDCNDVTSMKGHASKSVEDRVLKGMILQSILRAESEGLELTSQDIHNYISNSSFYFESPELDKYGKPQWSGDYTYDSLPGIRTGLSYLKRAGYVLKQGTERPYTFLLTEEGRLHADDPFFKYKIKQKYFLQMAEKELKRLLDNDEAVEALAEQKRLEKCKTCRLTHPKAKRLPARSWTVKPHQGKIGLQKKDGTINEMEVTEDGQIKELEDLKASLVTKDGKVDVESTILSQQNEIEGMRNLLAEAGIRYKRTVTQLKKEKDRKGKLDAKRLYRNMSRMEVAHFYGENKMYLDAEFFELWSGSLVVVEYKRLLELDGIMNVYYDLQSTKSEIMTRTDFSRRILEPDEIPNVEMQITAIKGGSIVIDSPYFKAQKSLTV